MGGHFGKNILHAKLVRPNAAQPSIIRTSCRPVKEVLIVSQGKPVTRPKQIFQGYLPVKRSGSQVTSSGNKMISTSINS